MHCLTDKNGRERWVSDVIFEKYIREGTVADGEHVRVPINTDGRQALSSRLPGDVDEFPPPGLILRPEAVKAMSVAHRPRLNQRTSWRD